MTCFPQLHEIAQEFAASREFLGDPNHRRLTLRVIQKT